MAFTAEEIEKFRKETAGTKHVVHLNNAGSGLMPDVVTQAQLDHIKLESEVGGYEAAALQATVVQNCYELAAKLFHCKSSNIAFASSATDAFAKALSSIPFERGDVILTDCDDYASNQIQFLSLQKRFGVKIVRINNATTGGVDLNDLEEKLKKYRPKLLAITHIPTNSGLVQPVKQIAAIYRKHREQHQGTSWYVLDACQSAGQLKLDVQELQCDFMSLTCRKFLRGPRGTGALYVSDAALSAGLEPMFIDMRGAVWTEKDEYRPQATAIRFEDWEFAYSTLVGTAAAIEYCLSVGEEKISDQIRFLSSGIREQLRALSGVIVLDRGTELGGIVTFHVKKSDPKYIVTELARRKINVTPSYRTSGLIDYDSKGVEWSVRASPHYYNTQGEIETFVSALKEIL